MMRIYKEIESLEEFETWSGATETKQTILEHGEDDEFIWLCEEMNPEGMTETELNDFLWFDSDFIFEHLGIDEEESEDDEE